MKYFTIKNASAFRIHGVDAKSYLQGQCSQDLDELQDGDSCYALWLSPKGRLLADGLIYQKNKMDFIIWNHGLPADEYKHLLEKNLIMDDAEVENYSSKLSLAYFEDCPSTGGEIVLKHPLGLSIVLADGSSENASDPEMSLDEFNFERLRRGIVSIPSEFGEKDLPVEAGLDECAVSYNKGCFLGQDMLARLRLQGDSRKVGVVLRGESSDDLSLAPCELFSEDRKVGEVRALAQYNGQFASIAKMPRKEISNSLYLKSADLVVPVTL